MKTLIVVDVQTDFIEGGALAVAGGNDCANKIATLIRDHQWDCVVFTKDWHVAPGGHWSATPDYVDSWPVHCKAGSWGAELHIGLVDAVVHRVDNGHPINVNTFFKGEFSAAYSGMEGYDKNGVSLKAWLDHNNVASVHVVGIAFDYCVKATAIDLADEGFDVTVLKEYTASVNPTNDGDVVEQMNQNGVVVDHYSYRS